MTTARTAATDTAATQTATPSTEQPAPGTEAIVIVATALPWPEPWRAQPGARPRTDYWDVVTASWQCCPAPGDVPTPRRGD